MNGPMNGWMGNEREREINRERFERFEREMR
jgi:hypothetical protein